MPKTFYTLQILIGKSNYLLPSEDSYILLDEIRDFLTPSAFLNSPQPQRGFLNLPPSCLYMRTEIEGETEHYGEDEISASLKYSELIEYNDLGANLYLFSERLINALKDGGLNEFIAQPAIVKHPSTNRTWTNFWFFSFTYSIDKALAQGSELVFTDLGTTAYYSAQLKKNIESLNLPNLDFIEHKLN